MSALDCMSSQCLEEAGKTRADLADCVAKLSLLLHNALTEAAVPLPGPHHSCLLIEPPLYTFSGPLLKALLAEESDIPSGSGEMFSFANQHRDGIARALETVSLRCLSTYLLRLPDSDGLELGLHLLTNEPEYTAESYTTQSEVNAPGSETVLPLVRKSLIEKAFSIFANGTGDARIRRMAGKVLMEMVYDPEEHCQVLEILNSDEGLRKIAGALSDTDIVLSFFSSTIMRAIYQSGSYSHWESNEPCSEMLHHIKMQGSAIGQFYAYVRAERQSTFSVGGRTRRDVANGALPVCYLVESDGAYASGLPQGTVLLILCADGLDLIHCGKDNSGWRTNYLTIRLTRQTRTKCNFSSGKGERKRLLALHIHEDDSTTLNDQERDLQDINLNINSEDDLTGMSKAFEAIGIRCQTKRFRTSPGNRRSSSVVIPLDMDDEIIPDSFPSSEVETQAVAGPTSPRVHWRNDSANKMECNDKPLEVAFEMVSQSSLTDLTRTPTLHATSSPGARESSRPTSPRSRTKSQTKKRTRSLGKTASPVKENLSDSVPAKNTRSRSSQKSKSVIANNVLKPIPHNTQESLIFPRRRTRAKLYTAARTKAVDWDEDLRASDASVDPESQRNSELTSVSSPSSSGARYTFNQSSKRPRGGSSRKKPAMNNKRQRNTASARQAKKRTRSGTNLLSPPLGRPKAGSSQLSQELRLDAEVANASVKKIAEPNSSFQAREAESIKINSPLPQRNDGWNSQSKMRSSLDQCNHLGGDNQGRGQTVAEKLIAALRGSSSPECSANQSYVDELFDGAEYGGPMVPKSSETQNEPALDKPLEHQGKHENDKQDIPGSWTSNMSQEGIPDDEIYPVKIYSGESSDASQSSSLQNNDEQKWVLGKGVALSGTGGGRENERARRTSSQVASSSVEPLSTESTPEVYYSSPSLKESKSSPFLSRPDEVASATGTVKAYSTEPGLKEHISTCLDHTEKIVSSSSKRNTTRATLEGTTSREYRLQIPSDENKADARLTTSGQKELIKDGAEPVAEYPDSGAKTIVDKNGSPRLMQQSKAAKEEHTIPKRRGNYFRLEQRSPKRMKGSDQKDGMGINLPTTTSARAGDTQGSFVPTEKSKTNLGASYTNSTKKEMHNPFLSRLQASAGERIQKDLKATLPGLKSSQEQQQTLGSREHALKETAEDEPEQKSSFGLSKGAAGRIDWQTSLRELHKGMERTLISNNEYLSRQIESERATINGVLDGYKEQCHNVLDHLFGAQMERIRMCKQQMHSIKQQHADVCQGLIRQLEENERTLEAAGGSQ
ncbi:uncharacterized protein DSM5745_08236 [Aspergillus mulundensis]|uniref:Uncharacterized protein n=1 Tax=Aspergillus mulundensis TaxID=1810919 RepID=A0A3D8R9M3_9EURO|nr:hypothetical protein DSM5745_08236 [Aspergillus mulundensis]RDW70725.1 hypothetical protein DSM5745_08236 [Aspergillus mulundensis]